MSVDDSWADELGFLKPEAVALRAAMQAARTPGDPATAPESIWTGLVHGTINNIYVVRQTYVENARNAIMLYVLVMSSALAVLGYIYGREHVGIVAFVFGHALSIAMLQLPWLLRNKVFDNLARGYDQFVEACIQGAIVTAAAGYTTRHSWIQSVYTVLGKKAHFVVDPEVRDDWDRTMKVARCATCSAEAPHTGPCGTCAPPRSRPEFEAAWLVMCPNLHDGYVSASRAIITIGRGLAVAVVVVGVLQRLIDGP